MVVPIFEPLSLHQTDADDAISSEGESLQASVMPRPMALTGAFPEVLVDAIRSPHLIPSNQPTYKVQETNLLVLSHIGIRGELHDNTLSVSLQLDELQVPADLDISPRQIIELTIVAIRKTLEVYQTHLSDPLSVSISILGTIPSLSHLTDLNTQFTIPPQLPAH